MTEKRKRLITKSERENFTSIADVLQSMQQPPSAEPAAEKNNIEIRDNTRCRFDMFVRYNKREKRDKHEFCYRGDFFEKKAERMLWSLVRMFANNHMRFFLAELYDNTKPMNDPERIILKFHGGVIIENRLQSYAPLLTQFPVPDWLINKK